MQAQQPLITRKKDTKKRKKKVTQKTLTGQISSKCYDICDGHYKCHSCKLICLLIIGGIVTCGYESRPIATSNEICIRL